MKHTLVVGGTGMLLSVSLLLIDKGYHLSIARNAERMKQLLQETSLNSNAISLLVDYRNNEGYIGLPLIYLQPL